MSEESDKKQPDIIKREIEKGPLGLEIETVTKLIKNDGKTVEETTEINPAQCPHCGRPIKDFSNLRGKCQIEGCSVEMMCSECAVTATCGKRVCKEHSYPVQGKDSEGQSTTIACEDHKQELRFISETSILADLSLKKKQIDSSEQEMEVRKSEAKAKQLDALVPLITAYQEGKIKRKELRLKAQDILRKFSKDEKEIEIKKEQNQLRNKEIEVEKELTEKEIKRKKRRDDKEMELEARAEERKREWLQYEKKMEKIRAALRKERINNEKEVADQEVERKRLRDEKEMSLEEKAEKRRWEELSHQEKRDAIKAALEKERINNNKEIAKEEAEVEKEEVERKKLRDKEEFSLRKRAEERRSEELEHKKKMDKVNALLEEKGINVKYADVLRKAKRDAGELEVEKKAEKRKSQELEHKRARDAVDLFLEGKKVEIREDEVKATWANIERKARETDKKLTLQKHIHDQDLAARLKKQAQQHKNEKAKRSLELLETVRKEKKDARDYAVELQKLSDLKHQLQSQSKDINIDKLGSDELDPEGTTGKLSIDLPEENKNGLSLGSKEEVSEPEGRVPNFPGEDSERSLWGTLASDGLSAGLSYTEESEIEEELKKRHPEISEEDWQWYKKDQLGNWH